MRCPLIIAGIAALVFPLINAQSQGDPVTGAQGNATVVEDNPVGPVYKATLPTKQFFNPNDPAGNIKGSISATANPDGIGVLFQVQFSNLPTEGGPFVYHLHVNQVPEDGNCNSTLGHIDPFIRGETPACNSALPQTCQVGDLSGKHGKITSDPFEAQYLDEFASTKDGLGSFFGNRSFVIHFANITRITCANFAREVGRGGNGTTSGNASSTSTGGPAMVTINGASSLGVSLISIFGLMAFSTLFSL